MSYEVTKYELPIDWEWCRIDEVCEPQMAKGEEGSVPYLEIGNIDIDNKNYSYGDKKSVKGALIANKGDVLVSRVRPTRGAITLLKEDQALVSSALSVLRPESKISNSYVFYYLAWSNEFSKYLGENSTGTMYPTVSKEYIHSYPVPLAPREQQIRIVDKIEELLSDLESGVDELKAAQTKLTQYRQSLLKSAVEGTLTEQWRKNQKPKETGAQLLERILIERRNRWEEQKLKEFKEKDKKPPKDWQKKYPEPVKPDTSELPELPVGWAWASIQQVAFDVPYSLAIGPFGSNLKVSDYTIEGVPLVFVRNIKSGVYGGENTKFVSTEKAEELKAHSVSSGDVLITKMGEPPGDADVYPSGQPDAIITADCIKVRCWPEFMLAQFLVCVINSQIGKKQILPMTKGVAQKKVSLGRFRVLAVPIPSFAEQQEIINKYDAELSNIKQQIQSTENSIKACEAQRKNILKSAFSGELVEQDPSDEPASVLLERIKAEREERAKQVKPKRVKKKTSEAERLMETLLEVLMAEDDWLDAQEAFRRCGVKDGTSSDRIEELYAELRQLDQEKILETKRVGDYDQLKLKS